MICGTPRDVSVDAWQACKFCGAADVTCLREAVRATRPHQGGSGLTPAPKRVAMSMPVVITPPPTNVNPQFYVTPPPVTHSAEDFAIRRQVVIQSPRVRSIGEMLITVPPSGPVFIRSLPEVEFYAPTGTTSALPGVVHRTIESSGDVRAVLSEGSLEQMGSVTPMSVVRPMTPGDIVRPCTPMIQLVSSPTVLPAVTLANAYESYICGGKLLSYCVLHGKQPVTDDHSPGKVEIISSGIPQGICRDRPATWF